MRACVVSFVVFLGACASTDMGQNYEASDVPAYELPDEDVRPDGEG